MEQNSIYAGVLVSLIVICIILAGCTNTGNSKILPPTTSPEKTPTETATSPGQVSPTSGYGNRVMEANNLFASDLYSRLSSDPANAGSNIFFSPFSISSALTLTYEGAKGKTADEIRSVFHLPADTNVLRQGFSDIDAGLNKGSGGNYTMMTANALWAEKSFAFLPAYTDAAHRYYDANTTNLDFIGMPDDSRQIINQWVEEKTANRIQNLIPAGVIGPATRLVITNAIYFKGNWVSQFDKNATQPMDFHVTPDKTVQVPMMEQIDPEARFDYAETGDLQILEMPYSHGTGDELSMVILLPKNASITAAEVALNPQNLTEIRNASSMQRVMVYFPKFRLETEYQLPATLSSMGMPTAFTGSADFSGMDGAKDLYISDVIHKAFVDVNEEGTEAAAATGVVMRLTAVYNPGPVPVFKADHPFLFLIQDKDTGTILFVGRVTNPNGS